MPSSISRRENGDTMSQGAGNLAAYQAIGDEGGMQALAMVADIMERNQAATAGMLESLYEGEVEAHKLTKRRLAIAEARLAQAQERFARLFDYDPDFWAGA